MCLCVGEIDRVNAQQLGCHSGFAPHSPPVAEDRSLSGQLREKQLNEEMEQHCTDGAGRAPVQS